MEQVEAPSSPHLAEHGTAVVPRPTATSAPRFKRRRRIVVGGALVSALVSVGGIIGASFVKSPAQLAADTAAPPRTLLEAKVVRQVLTSTTVIRGLVYASPRYDIIPAAASLEITGLYVSRLNVKAGDQISNGEVLAEVSGQPLFVMAGAVPAYRDMKPADTGTDIRELQAALASLGFSCGTDPAGFFGEGTTAAVEAYYRHVGYQAPMTGAASPAAAAEPVVPHGEVVFLPSFPAKIIAVNGSVGQAVAGPLMSLTSGQLALTGELPASEQATIKTGMRVQIYDENLNKTADGVVGGLGTPTTTTPTGTVVTIGGSGSSATSSSTSGSGGSNNGGDSGAGGGTSLFTPVLVSPDAPLPAEFDGENVRLTVDTGSSVNAVLAVPVAAIFTTASGQTEVTVVEANGALTNTPVTAGISANGYVQVTPLRTGSLREGDSVVIGR